MQRISSWAARQPRWALGGWLAAIVALAIFGHSVGSHLQATSTRIDGSSSATAGRLTATHFADDTTLPILLTGPSHDVRAQGHALADRLAAVPGVSVLSPWNDTAHRKLLRPRSDRLLILASVRGSEQAAQLTAVRMRAMVGQVHAPVRGRITGVPLVAQDLRAASGHTARNAELVALPLLALMLLFVFRSLAAALIPVAFGTATVLASGGVIRLLTHLTAVDPLATALASMMGLALAVDYSLLIVSRYRDEIGDGRSRDEAIMTATRTTAHVVGVAGLAVVGAMALAAGLAAGQAVASAMLGVAAAAVLAMAGAAVALPAVLALAGERLAAERRDGRPAAPRGSRWAGVTTVILRRPALAATATAAVLLVLALPALSQSTSAPDVGQLPKSSSARADYEAISTAIGPGWAAGFDIVSVARTGTMTTPARLAALERFQHSLQRDPDVAAVLGPGQLAARARKLRKSGRDLLHSQDALRASLPKQRARLDRLGNSVGSASGNVGELQGSLRSAKGATEKLATGGSALKSGAGRLTAGVQAASAGARGLDRKVIAATANSGAIAAGVHRAQIAATGLTGSVQTIAAGSARVAPVVRTLQAHDIAARDGVRRARDAAGQQRSDAVTSILNAKRALTLTRPTAGTFAARLELEKAQRTLQADPVQGLSAIADGLAADATTAAGLAAGVSSVDYRALAAQARSLSGLLAKAASQQGNLEQGVKELTASIGGMRAAIGRLGGGSDALSVGLKSLDAGITRLQAGAAAGSTRAQALASGIAGVQGALEGVQSTTGAPADASSGTSARNAITSGYFVLAALDANGRTGGQTGLDVERGGQASRIVVIPKTAANDPRTRALQERLSAAAARFARATDAASAVGGPAATLGDYQHATSARLLLIVLALALATALLLAVVLRSVPVAVIGVALNLLAVGATLGIMDRLFTGPTPLLGGPGQLDATALTAVFAVMFALATDYQVFVVTRIREELLAGRSPRAAVAAGLARTARVVTGAALSMVAVFVAFGTADVASLQQFGIGLAIAVTVDATVVRLVLLPSLLTLGGRAVWWPQCPPEGHPSADTAAPSPRTAGAVALRPARYEA